MSLIQELTEYFRTVLMLHRRVLDKKVSKTGVFRSQHRILMYLSKHPLAAQNEIAKAMDISPAAVATSLKKLEKGGYIEKAINREDNRFYQVDITQKGMDVVKQSFEIFHTVDAQMFDGFSDDEKRQMVVFLNKIHTNLQKIEEQEEM